MECVGEEENFYMTMDLNMMETLLITTSTGLER